MQKVSLVKGQSQMTGERKGESLVRVPEKGKVLRIPSHDSVEIGVIIAENYDRGGVSDCENGGGGILRGGTANADDSSGPIIGHIDCG